VNNSPVSRLSRLCRRSTLRSSSLASTTTSAQSQQQQQQQSSSSVGGSASNVMVDPTIADWLSFRQQQRSAAVATTAGTASTSLDPSSAGGVTAVPSVPLAFTLDDRFSRASSYSPEPVSLLTSPSLLQHRPEDSTYTSSGLVYLQRGITLQSPSLVLLPPLIHLNVVYYLVRCAEKKQTTTITTTTTRNLKETIGKQHQV